MNLKCHFSALEPALLSIENKLIIFDLTIFNYGISNISFFNQSQNFTISIPKTQFSPCFCPFPPYLFSWKTLICKRIRQHFINNLN